MKLINFFFQFPEHKDPPSACTFATSTSAMMCNIPLEPKVTFIKEDFSPTYHESYKATPSEDKMDLEFKYV
jgi:hypothetical protein